MTIPVGARVRPSQRVVERKRQDMIKYTGGQMRRVCETAYERERDRRGTVVADLSRVENGFTYECLRVQWDDGGIGECLSYMVEVVK